MSVNSLAALKGLPKGINKAVQKEVEPGKYENLDVTIRLQVPVMNVGAPYQQRFVQKAKPWDLLGKALSKLNGVTVASLVREVLEEEMPAEEVTKIKKEADAAMLAIKGQTWQRAEGKVTMPEGVVVTVSQNSRTG